MTYVMMITGMTLWSVYAVMHEAWMFVVWNSLAVVLQFVVIGMTLYYARRRAAMPEQYDRRAGH